MSDRARRRRRADKKVYALDRMNKAIERLLSGGEIGSMRTVRWIVRWGLITGATPPAKLKLRERKST